MMKRKIGLYLFFISCCISALTAQTATKVEAIPGGYIVPAAEYEGELIPAITMPEVNVYAPWKFISEKQRKKYDKLVRDVKKVLPIAREVNAIIIETYEYMETLPNEKAREAHIKQVEKGLKKQYTPRLKKLTLTQGKILIKLVNRETHSSGYELVKAFMGSFKAFFYQSFAALFGASLKKEFNPEQVKEDKMIEHIIKRIEAGQL